MELDVEWVTCEACNEKWVSKIQERITIALFLRTVRLVETQSSTCAEDGIHKPRIWQCGFFS